MAQIIQFDRDLLELRRMWKTDRHRFSGELVRLTIKQKRDMLTEQDQHRLKTIERVIEENNNDWLNGYDLDTLYMR